MGLCKFSKKWFFSEKYTCKKDKLEYKFKAEVTINQIKAYCWKKADRPFLSSS